MAIDMSQFYQVFFEESAEHLAAMESLLLELDVDNPDPEQLNAIFRAAHSIKGSAGTFGFTDLAEATHVLENLLDRIRKQELGLRPEMVDACLQCGDLLKGMLGAHQGQGAVDMAAVQTNAVRLRELTTDRAAVQADAPPASPVAAQSADAAPASQRVFAIQFVPTEVSAMGDGVNNLLEELKLLGEVEIVRQPETGVHSVGFWEVRLCSDFGQEAFVEQIDFIADNGAWRVFESAPDGGPDEKPFGIFADAPGAPAAETADGFFEPSEYADASSPPATTADDAAYGFFAPLPSATAFTAAADDSYGFFEPLPTPGVATTGEPKAAMPADPAGSAAAGGAVADKAPAAMRGRQPRSVADASIRVSVEKVDQLINLVGELVITQAMLLQTAAHMQDSAPEPLLNGLTQLERNTRDLQESAPERLLNGLTLLERNTRDLQEAVLSIRMMPISSVFSRFPRVVRDLSVKLGKQVELKMSGESTELDKGLVERIVDPLTHLIRNSLDHGIETPASRIAAGKAPAGTITLRASHQGGNIVIEVGDDGAGLPRDKILSKARERGLPVSEQMTDQEVFQLIFEAGFSTAE
ncbi:MAG TPA: Hpt domain-containing protein, partial [Azonexus sp.]|nr:Hpt domain-containing protein [Azonexus sp.]